MENLEKGNSRTLNRRGFISLLSGIAGVAVVGSLAASCNKDDGVYAIDASKCTGCKDCFSSCAYNAITMSGDVAVISASQCVGCGKCVSQCNDDAIYKA